MRNILGLVSATILAASLSAQAAEPAVKDTTTTTTTTHTAEAMTSGHHMMPGNKHDQMSNKAGMPGLNPKCSDQALAKMPPEHRAACHKN